MQLKQIDIKLVFNSTYNQQVMMLWADTGKLYLAKIGNDWIEGSFSKGWSSYQDTITDWKTGGDQVLLFQPAVLDIDGHGRNYRARALHSSIDGWKGLWEIID